MVLFTAAESQSEVSLCIKQRTPHALIAMKSCGRGGVIINIGSSSARGGREGQGAYSASKAGIQCLTETLAIEGREAGKFAAAAMVNC